jgi:serine/threonine protein phosphatase PrpC
MSDTIEPVEAPEPAEAAEDQAAAGACPSCGSPLAPGDRFCEECGADLGVGEPAAAAEPAEPVEPADLPAGRPCQACGGAVDADGYCTTCGVKAVAERDHWAEHPASWVAGVCDRGRRHERNEDALATAADPEPGGVAVLVVCDGVSSAPDSDVASLAAARAARDVLCSPLDGTETVAAGPEASTGPAEEPGRPAPAAADRLPAHAGDAEDRALTWGEALGRAAAAAHEAAVAAAKLLHPADAVEPDHSPPSCTFVAAVADGPLLITGCVGDSRAYWLPDAGEAVQLTTDDSWAAEAMARGVPREEAETGPHAHAITRWLGIDSPDPTPSLVQYTVEGAGWALVCSDGLWNYCSEAADLATLVGDAAGRAGSEPSALADELVAWANGRGGHDNISVALARLGEPPGAPPVEGATNTDG